MPVYALEAELDGLAFHGTAIQAAGPTLTGLLREVLATIDGGPALSRTSSRLDAGVSAERLVISVICAKSWPPVILARALNAHLPPAVRVLRVAAVADGWDALEQTRSKTYRYQVLERGSGDALDPRWHSLRRLQHAALLPSLASALVGRRDLGAFACRRGDASDEADAVRDIYACTWETTPARPGQRHRFRIHGSGFLYKQVRGIVGALLAVGTGAASPEDLLQARDAGRGGPRVGQIAPPQALLLESVDLLLEPDWQEV